MLTKIVKGNAFGLRLQLEPVYLEGSPVDGFDVAQAHPALQMKSVAQNSWVSVPYEIIDAKTVTTQFDGDLPLGVYGFQMSGVWEDEEWRWCAKTVFMIVEETKSANLPVDGILLDDTLIVTPVITFAKGKDGRDGKDGKDGIDGKDGKDGEDGKDGKDGSDGITPHIDPITGDWFVGDEDTGVHAQGPQGVRGPQGERGEQGLPGVPGTTNYNDLENKPDLSIYELVANKKTTITGNELSTTYYPTTSAVAGYVSGVVGDINSILDEINGEVI